MHLFLLLPKTKSTNQGTPERQQDGKGKINGGRQDKQNEGRGVKAPETNTCQLPAFQPGLKETGKLPRTAAYCAVHSSRTWYIVPLKLLHNSKLKLFLPHLRNYKSNIFRPLITWGAIIQNTSFLKFFLT